MIRFGIAGTGWMAEQMARTIARSGAARVYRVASASDDRARDYRAEWGAAAHGDYRSMLDDPAVEAIYIAGRNATHAAQSIAALEAGKPVLCEKPLGLNLAEASAVIAAAKRKGILYMEAIATPFLPAVAEALSIVRSRRLGGVQRIEASFGYPADRARDPRLYAGDGGVLADRAVYPLMLALLALGPVERSEVDVRRDDGVDVAASFSLTHADGALSHLAVSLVERLGNAMRIICEDGVIDIAPPLLTARHMTVRRATSPGNGQWRQHPVLRRLIDLKARFAGDWYDYGASPYLPELHYFCGLLRSGAAESPVITHDRMREVARLIDEARRS